MSFQPRKAIFDSVRRMLGRGFRPAEVSQLDRAIDCAEGGEEACEEPTFAAAPTAGRSIGERGIALIKRFEGCARKRPDGLVEAYPDPASGGDPWTIGWGSTGAGIGPGTVWTQEECDARLERDLVKYAADVAAVLGDAPTTQAQFDALVSFHYNTGAIGRATLTRRHVAGDQLAAEQEFARWNMAAGKRLKGLTRRRGEEAALYRS